MQPADAGDLRGRVPGLLPDAAGGSGERGHFWHEQQNTAANNFRRFIGRLAQGLSPVFTRRPKPDQISYLLDQLQRTQEEERSRSQTNFQLQTASEFQFQ